MKGRLTYDQINAVVQDLNKAVVGKYKILHQPLKSMNASVRNLYHRFLGEETKDTKGTAALICSQNNRKIGKTEQNPTTGDLEGFSLHPQHVGTVEIRFGPFKIPMGAPTTPCHRISGPPFDVRGGEQGIGGVKPIGRSCQAET